METGVAYLFAIIFIVIALNFYFLFFRVRRGNSRYKRMGRQAVDEAKQALWRDKEVARRIEREQDDAYERVKLRNETLAYYEEVRRRHAIADEAEKLELPPGVFDDYLNFDKYDDLKSLEAYENRSIENEMTGYGSYLPELTEAETETDKNEMDPFDIFKNKK